MIPIFRGAVQYCMLLVDGIYHVLLQDAMFSRHPARCPVTAAVVPHQSLEQWPGFPQQSHLTGVDFYGCHSLFVLESAQDLYDSLRSVRFSTICMYKSSLVLMLRTCFLIALASDDCRSEIHAMSGLLFIFRFGQNYSDVTFIHDLLFLA